MADCGAVFSVKVFKLALRLAFSIADGAREDDGTDRL